MSKTQVRASPLEQSLKGFRLREKKCPVAVRNAPLNVPLDVCFNYSQVLNRVTFSCVIDTRILVNVLAFFSFYTSAVSSAETEHDGHMAVLCPLLTTL